MLTLNRNGLLPTTLLILSFTSPLPAQITFQRTYGGTDPDAGKSVQQTTDGGYIIAGGTGSFGATRSGGVWLVKTDAYGDTLWTRTFGGANDNRCYSVQQTADGGYVIAGCTESHGANDLDVWLIKTDAAGDTMWTRTHGDSGRHDYGYAVAQTTDGGYVIRGSTYSFSTGGFSVYLVRTDATGDTLWTRTYGGIDDEGGLSVTQTADGGYVITGGIGGSFNSRYAWLIKTDAAGDTVWTRTYDGTSYGKGCSATQTEDGGYIIAGENISFGAGATDVWLIKTDSSGDTMWTRTFGGAGSDGAYSVAQTTDGGYVITGYTWSFGTGNKDAWLIKTDASGDTVWTRTYGGMRNDYSNSVAQTADGGYILTGVTDSYGAGDCDLWLIKTDAAGNAPAIAEP